MKTSVQQKIILIIAATSFIATVVVIGLLVRSTWREHQIILDKEQELQARTAEARHHRQLQEAYVRRALSGDRDFFERIVRQQLGYVKRDEIVYRFDAPAND